jgi:hypothetical protein
LHPKTNPVFEEDVCVKRSEKEKKLRSVLEGWEVGIKNDPYPLTPFRFTEKQKDHFRIRED